MSLAAMTHQRQQYRTSDYRCTFIDFKRASEAPCEQLIDISPRLARMQPCQRGRQCCAKPCSFLQSSLLSQISGFPPAHWPEAEAMVAVAEVTAFASLTLPAAPVLFAKVTALPV